MLDQDGFPAFLEALRRMDAGFSALPEHQSTVAGVERMSEALNATVERLRDNYPYFHPLYAAQMLKPPHAVARLAYALAMWINPNNHALDGGRATSAMEEDAVAEIAGMCGWKHFLGHLCGGGTMANLEAWWVAGHLSPGKILASEQAHYTHGRISSVLQLPFESLPCDAPGRMDVHALTKRLERGGVGTVVATMGTTATGSVDPLPEILALRVKHGFRIHADAAYGGYFVLAENLEERAGRAFARIGEADSIVIDPHKHGLQPFGCGCVLFRDPGVGRLYKHDSPYTYFSSAELHIVVFASRAQSISETSALSRRIFESAARHELHLAVAELPVPFWKENLRAMNRDRETVTCLRSVLMKPEHFDWVERIWELLSKSTEEILKAGN